MIVFCYYKVRSFFIISNRTSRTVGVAGSYGKMKT